MNRRGDDDKDDHNHPSPYCPSFNAYTSNTQIAEIASRVVTSLEINDGCDTNLSDDDDFEFGTGIPEFMPVYPVFNRDLLRDLGSEETSAEKVVQLRNLFFEEDNDPERLSTSSELDEVAPETYCLWAPKSPETPSPSRCMKSSSTGSGPAPVVAKTWRLRNLLRRSKSDGKEGLMLMSSTTPSKGKEKGSKDKSRPSSPSPSPPRGGGGNKEVGGKRRKSYLPYKQELLGLFGSPQTLRSMNLPPF